MDPSNCKQGAHETAKPSEECSPNLTESGLAPSLVVVTRPYFGYLDVDTNSCRPVFHKVTPILGGMSVQAVQAFKLGVRPQFERLTTREKRYAHHMARYEIPRLTHHRTARWLIPCPQGCLVRGKDHPTSSLPRGTGDIRLHP